jgi:hypothetical protein
MFGLCQEKSVGARSMATAAEIKSGFSEVLGLSTIDNRMCEKLAAAKSADEFRAMTRKSGLILSLAQCEAIMAGGGSTPAPNPNQTTLHFDNFLASYSIAAGDTEVLIPIKGYSLPKYEALVARCEWDGMPADTPWRPVASVNGRYDDLWPMGAVSGAVFKAHLASDPTIAFTSTPFDVIAAPAVDSTAKKPSAA